MLHLDEMAPMDGLSATLKSGQRTVARVGRDSVGAAAMTAVRTAQAVLPRDWLPWLRPRPRRWPFVVGALLLGSLVGILFLFRQPIMGMSEELAMPGTPHPQMPPDPDASDVVSGPVGDAELRDPATSGPEGADLTRLLEIEMDLDEAPPSPTIIR